MLRDEAESNMPLLASVEREAAENRRLRGFSNHELERSQAQAELEVVELARHASQQIAVGDHRHQSAVM